MTLGESEAENITQIASWYKRAQLWGRPLLTYTGCGAAPAEPLVDETFPKAEESKQHCPGCLQLLAHAIRSCTGLPVLQLGQTNKNSISGTHRLSAGCYLKIILQKIITAGSLLYNRLPRSTASLGKTPTNNPPYCKAPVLLKTLLFLVEVTPAELNLFPLGLHFL